MTAVLGSRDRDPRADDAGEGRCRRGTAAVAMMMALISVASLLPAVAVTPLAGVEEPAKAMVGCTAVSATATTVATALARPIDENIPFRANISNILRGSWPEDRPRLANHQARFRFPNPNGS
jgi:hypothetical protein